MPNPVVWTQQRTTIQNTILSTQDESCQEARTLIENTHYSKVNISWGIQNMDCTATQAAHNQRGAFIRNQRTNHSMKRNTWKHLKTKLEAKASLKLRSNNPPTHWPTDRARSAAKKNHSLQGFWALVLFNVLCKTVINATFRGYSVWI